MKIIIKKFPGRLVHLGKLMIFLPILAVGVVCIMMINKWDKEDR